ncbi:MAG: hypothetical protein ACYTF7_10190 [Planctomycetota bacterium]|jgi:hypothetical protein
MRTAIALLAAALCVCAAHVADAQEPDVVSLERSIHPLQEWFESYEGKPRVLAVLSPRCEHCVAGARAIREALGREDVAAGLEVGIVWIPMVEGDGHDAALEMASLFDRDPRVTQFEDPTRLLGQRLEKQLLMEGAGPAWDIYLRYSPEARWDRELPTPDDWVHQFSGDRRADPDRFRTGEALVLAIREMI